MKEVKYELKTPIEIEKADGNLVVDAIILVAPNGTSYKQAAKMDKCYSDAMMSVNAGLFGDKESKEPTAQEAAEQKEKADKKRAEMSDKEIMDAEIGTVKAVMSMGNLDASLGCLKDLTLTVATVNNGAIFTKDMWAKMSYPDLKGMLFVYMANFIVTSD